MRKLIIIVTVISLLLGFSVTATASEYDLPKCQAVQVFELLV